MLHPNIQPNMQQTVHHHQPTACPCPVQYHGCYSSPGRTFDHVFYQQQPTVYASPVYPSAQHQSQSLQQPVHSQQNELRLQNQVQDLTKEVSQLEKKNQDDQTVINSLRQEIQQLKEDFMTRECQSQSLMKDLEVRITQLNSDMKAKELDLREKDMSLESKDSDLRKANDIIGKLQEQVEKSQRKVSLLSEVSSRQEKVVSEKMSKMKELESDLKLCINKISQKEQQQAKLSQDLQDLKDQLKQAKEVIETNESLIHFLNKQIAAKDMTGKTVSANITNVKTSLGSDISSEKQTKLMQQQIKALKQSSAVDKKIQEMNLNAPLMTSEHHGSNKTWVTSPVLPPEPTAAPRLVQFHGLPSNIGDKNPVASNDRTTNNNRYQRNPLSSKTHSNNSHSANNGFITTKGVK